MLQRFFHTVWDLVHDLQCPSSLSKAVNSAAFSLKIAIQEVRGRGRWVWSSSRRRGPSRSRNLSQTGEYFCGLVKRKHFHNKAFTDLRPHALLVPWIKDRRRNCRGRRQYREIRENFDESFCLCGKYSSG